MPLLTAQWPHRNLEQTQEIWSSRSLKAPCLLEFELVDITLPLYTISDNPISENSILHFSAEYLWRALIVGSKV